MAISNKRLFIIVFITGAIVMILELVGSRILAPTLGTSIFVWTSLIGIILGAMSLGYYLGGKLADKNPNRQTYANMILLAGIFVFFIIIMKGPILKISSIFGLRDAAVFSSITLFAVPGMLLGAVSPYSVRLAMKNVETSGNTVGNLYAVSTFGSIAGTFLAGFYLIPSFGSSNILYALAIALFFVSFIANEKRERLMKITIVLVLSLGISMGVNAMEKTRYLIDEDSAYNHIRVYDTIDKDRKRTRIMAVENFFDSGMYLDSDDLVFEYSKYFRLSDAFNVNIKRVAVFGGAAYSIPKDMLKSKNDINVDVVEIDGRTTQIAEKYFNLNTNDKRLKIYHQDARTFLNDRSRNISEKYDAVYNDAFSSTCTTPFHLTTYEAIKEIRQILNNDDGVYVMNLISSIKGEKSEFFKAEYKTLKQVFRNVYIFPTGTNLSEYAENNQNLVVIATNANIDIEKMREKYKGSDYGRMLGNLWEGEINADNSVILTDDYAPVDHYTSKLCRVINNN